MVIMGRMVQSKTQSALAKLLYSSSFSFHDVLVVVVVVLLLILLRLVVTSLADISDASDSEASPSVTAEQYRSGGGLLLQQPGRRQKEENMPFWTFICRSCQRSPIMRRRSLVGRPLRSMLIFVVVMDDAAVDADAGILLLTVEEAMVLLAVVPSGF